MASVPGGVKLPLTELGSRGRSAFQREDRRSGLGPVNLGSLNGVRVKCPGTRQLGIQVGGPGRGECRDLIGDGERTFKTRDWMR